MNDERPLIQIVEDDTRIAGMLSMGLSREGYPVRVAAQLHALDPAIGQVELVKQTIRTKFSSCLYTALTTVVAFGSLLFSGIRPVTLMLL